MHCRPMQDYDLRPVSQVAALAWAQDHLFKMRNPHAESYPDDFRKGFLRRLQSRLRMPGFTGLVCVADWKDTAWLPDSLTKAASAHEDIILGYSLWMRNGSVDDPMVRPWYQQHNSMLAKVNQCLWAWERWYIESLGLDRSLDVQVEREYRNATSTSDDFSRLDSFWMLRALATHPAAVRRGVGSRLLEWGMSRAEEEGVPATLHASPDGMLLYSRMGFKTVAWTELDCQSFVHAHPAMVYDPHGKHVRDARPDEAQALPNAEHKIDVVWREVAK